MSRFTRQSVVVGIGPCRCPGTPHEQDEVYLRPTISLDGGIRAQGAIMKYGSDTVELTAAWTGIFLRDGITGWNLTNGDGGPEALDVDGLLMDLDAARPVADRAAELYGESVMRPFLPPPQMTSPPTSTDASTSAEPTSILSRRESSSPPASEALTQSTG